MKIVFFGTPKFSVPFLKELFSNPEIEIAAVVTQPDKPVGRKGVLTSPESKLFAIENNIPTLQFKSLKTEEAQLELSKMKADIFVVVAYGKIIPKNILDLPPKGCINVHPSLLPKHRGPAPMQGAILDNDAETAVSIMLLDEGMDTGPVLAQKEIKLDRNETYLSLQHKVHKIGPALLVQTLDKWMKGDVVEKPQDDSLSTITKLLTKEDGKINWNEPAETIERKMRALTPWPGVWFEYGEKRIKVLKSIVSEDNGTQIGKVIKTDDRILVVCGNDTSLELFEIQPEGKSQMKAIDFVRGQKDFINSVL
jgi:methionyl-tRNA formyltransferase